MATLNEQLEEMQDLGLSQERQGILRALKAPEDNLTKLLDYLGQVENTLGGDWPVLVLFSDGSGRILPNTDGLDYDQIPVKNFATPLDLFNKE